MIVPIYKVICTQDSCWIRLHVRYSKKVLTDLSKVLTDLSKSVN